MTDREVLEEVFKLAMKGLDGAYEDAHNFDGKATPEEMHKAQGKKDAYRVILVTARQADGLGVHAKPGNWNEASNGCPFCGAGHMEVNEPLYLPDDDPSILNIPAFGDDDEDDNR